MKKIVLLLLLAINSNLFAQQSKTEKIDSLMTAVYNRGQFTGSILIADHGKVVYEKAFGLADREKKIPFTVNTQEYIGSISKQFTAMGTMILKDRQKLNYNQSIRDFFPELPAFMQPVTIRNLLYHTSGLAIFDDHPDMTEKDVFNILLKQDKLNFTPGEKFEYCNAGYSLLGMIIEKISDQSLNTFMTENIFKPLGMDHTEVNEISHRNTSRAIGYTMYGGIDSYDSFMGGNVSIISTAADLYKWDEALYHLKLVKPETLAEDFTPSDQVMKNPALLLKDNTFGDKSYGFGIWIAMRNGAKDFFHDGAFSGYMTYNERMTSSHTTIIEVSNLRHDPVYEIREAIVNILENRPYRLPKITASVWLNDKIAAAGIDSAISGARVLLNNYAADYDFSQNDLNGYAYTLLRANQVNNAIKVFELNTELYPNSWNVYDSLADAYEKAGDKAKELENCKKALELDPNNEYEKNRVKGLQSN
ncbi:MAG TPA: serine hydrolase [Mucilaginibacter sp.]|jgi:CubicO group peptidase (beta-lactamase class C family)|nr:serine hydrolase [Mucilaginibacter sp.]